MKQVVNKITASQEEPSFCTTAYIINLKKRTDRKSHVLEQFRNRHEFALKIIDAIEDPFGPLGLWKTIQYIINHEVEHDAEYILIGEDDLEFTNDYSKAKFFDSISEAKVNGADILLGGVSWFEDVVNVSNRLFWVNNFSGLHFTVIFKQFFSVISNADLKSREAADFHLGKLTDNVLFIYPFFAVQKDFGYSDATPENNLTGQVKMLFASTARRLAFLSKIHSFYQSMSGARDNEPADQFDNALTIPTYVINLPERTDKLVHIKKQFYDKPEFDLQIIEACKHEIGAFGLWLSIKKIISIALASDYDVIIICKDDHEFTQDYSKDFLIKNIIEAYQEGASFLSGGTTKWHDAVPVTKNRFWVDNCLSAQFLVIYKDFFSQIEAYPYDETIVTDLVYSKIALNKMILYPFVSVQKDFSYSDVTLSHSLDKNLVNTLFIESDLKLKRVQQAYLKYQK